MSRPRLYSRHGCATCKRRKKKCDEQHPVCFACQRLDLTCIWEPSRKSIKASHPTTTVSKVYKLSLSPRVRMRVKEVELNRIGFFHVQTLPLLELCQPSIDWAGMLGAFMHKSSACRNIVAAIGTQQKSLMFRTDTFAHDADVAYQYALTAWRAALADSCLVEAPLVIFACLLLILLESMRESANGLHTHLRVAVKMCNLLDVDSGVINYLRGIFGLLQTLCTSTKIFHFSPFDDGPKLMPKINTTLEGLCRNEDLQFGTQTAIASLIDIRQLHEQNVLDELPYQGSFKALARRLKAESKALLQDNPWTIANHANAILFDISCNVGASGDVPASDKQSTPFEDVLLLIEDCLVRLKAKFGSSDLPFAIGLDITQKLDLVLATTKSPSVRQKAIELLRCSPAHEGLWVADKVHELRSGTNA